MELDSHTVSCVPGNETDIVITHKHGLEDNRLYGYRIIAQNEIGNSPSVHKYFSKSIIAVRNFQLHSPLTTGTSDVERVVLTRITDYSCEIQCHFINGSDARGCKVVIVSNHTIVDNITVTLLRADETESIASTTMLNLTRVFDCYHHVFAYDIEANNSTSNLAITGKLNITTVTVTECIFATEGNKYN